MDREPNGKFAKGNGGGPGRPKRAVEEKYLRRLRTCVKLADWQEIVEQAVKDAKKGDDKARQFLADYLVGKPVQRQEITGADGGALIIRYVNDWRGTDE